MIEYTKEEKSFDSQRVPNNQVVMYASYNTAPNETSPERVFIDIEMNF